MPQTDNPSAIAAALATGDVSALSVEQKGIYYKQVCESLGLNYLTSPLYFQTGEDGRETLAVNKVGAAQLRKIHGISIIRVEREIRGGVAIFTAYGKDKEQREDSATGVSDISEFTGARLANAIMGAETKAKNRLTVSLSGVGFLDESEVTGRAPRTVLAETPLAVPEAAGALAAAVNQAPATETKDTRPQELPATLLQPQDFFSAPAPIEAPIEAPKLALTAPEQPVLAPEPAPEPPQPQPAPETPAAPASVQGVPHSGVAGIQEAMEQAARANAQPIAPEDIPATPAEYQQFVTNRASKLLRDVLQKNNVKNANTLIQEFFVRESGKQSLKKISAATWERMLSMLENKPLDEVVAALKGGKK